MRLRLPLPVRCINSKARHEIRGECSHANIHSACVHPENDHTDKGTAFTPNIMTEIMRNARIKIEQATVKQAQTIELVFPPKTETNSEY